MDETTKLSLSALSLFGLSIGDAFGESFFGKEEEIHHRLQAKQLKPGPWEYTDDTVMGMAVFEQLVKNEEINQDELALAFAYNYRLDPHRGYGGTAHSILRSIVEGNDWREVSAAVFDRMGSMGNGAAMRAGPIGAYFYDDVDKTIQQARLSAEITHANEEGICGAIAVALATHYAAASKSKFNSVSFFEFIQSYLPASDVKSKIGKAAVLDAGSDIRTAVVILGNGSKLTARDTVPFALWCAAHHHNHFEKALWKAVSALGDRDTIGAIVGSVVALSAPKDTIPRIWIERTEKLNHPAIVNEIK